MKRTKINDPSDVRLSEHFLLSDFLGCHSVYAKGLQNIFYDPDGGRLAEGKHLCETILEPLLEKHGPLSISYGYISPGLSKQIVGYQDPTKPSYHRWDKGAAADVCVHSWVKKRAPIFLANEIDGSLPYSRMITYSESPFICVATQLDEGDKPRRAFYENRYCGEKGAKPLYLRKTSNLNSRKAECAKVVLEHPWQGGGFPSYHGGGIRQMQHLRASKYSTVSDFLFSSEAISKGAANLPSPTKHIAAFRQAGAVYDHLLKQLQTPRLNIVRGFESFRFNDYPLFSWTEHFAIDFKYPSYIKAADLMDAALAHEFVSTASIDNKAGVVRVIGVPI